MKHGSNTWTRSRVQKIASAWAAAAVVSLAMFASSRAGYGHSVSASGYRRYSPHMTEASVTRKSLNVCASFADSARILSDPQFLDERFLSPGLPVRYRPVWTTVCEVDNKKIYVQFSDITGNLIGIMPVDGSSGSMNLRSIQPSVRTASEAAAIAVSRMWAMSLVPKDARISQSSTPELVDNGRAWRTMWRANTMQAGRGYEVKVVVARCGGIPIIALNGHERDSFMRD